MGSAQHLASAWTYKHASTRRMGHVRRPSVQNAGWQEAIVQTNTGGARKCATQWGMHDGETMWIWEAFTLELCEGSVSWTWSMLVGNSPEMGPGIKYEWIVIGATCGKTWLWSTCLEKWKQEKWAVAVTYNFLAQGKWTLVVMCQNFLASILSV